MKVFLGGMTFCLQCGETFEYVPIDALEMLGAIPAGARMMWAGDLPPAEWDGDPLWGGDWLPDTCARCDPNAWFLPVTTGASFFRS